MRRVTYYPPPAIALSVVPLAATAINSFGLVVDGIAWLPFSQLVRLDMATATPSYATPSNWAPAGGADCTVSEKAAGELYLVHNNAGLAAMRSTVWNSLTNTQVSQSGLWDTNYDGCWRWGGGAYFYGWDSDVGAARVLPDGTSPSAGVGMANPGYVIQNGTSPILCGNTGFATRCSFTDDATWTAASQTFNIATGSVVLSQLAKDSARICAVSGNTAFILTIAGGTVATVSLPGTATFYSCDAIGNNKWVAVNLIGEVVYIDGNAGSATYIAPPTGGTYVAGVSRILYDPASERVVTWKQGNASINLYQVL